MLVPFMRFLGALFAGFAAGYLVLLLKKLTSKLPQSLNSVRPMIIYPVIGILSGSVVTTLINPLMGMINDALTNALNCHKAYCKPRPVCNAHCNVSG